MSLLLQHPMPSGARWYCVHTKPRAELQAMDNLQRQQFECFLPRIARSVIRNGQRTRLVEPLFPRYLFLRADPTTQSLASVRSTRGAQGLVRFANQPGEVPAALIAQLRGDCDTQDVIHYEDDTPAVGDRVSVLGGAFAGLNGIYTETRGEHRAIVLLQLLGSACTVLLPRNTLQKVPAACAA